MVSSVTIVVTLLPRFARHAVVTFRPDSSPPFLPAVYLREVQKDKVSGFAALDVCQSVRDKRTAPERNEFE